MGKIACLAIMVLRKKNKNTNIGKRNECLLIFDDLNKFLQRNMKTNIIQLKFESHAHFKTTYGRHFTNSFNKYIKNQITFADGCKAMKIESQTSKEIYNTIEYNIFSVEFN